MLVFGPEGVGKSRLLNTFVENHPLALYVAQMRSPREFLLALLQALHSADKKIKVPETFPRYHHHRSRVLRIGRLIHNHSLWCSTLGDHPKAATYDQFKKRPL